MKVLVVGSLKNIPNQPELCVSFVEKLFRMIVERGYVSLEGCIGSPDKTIAEAADARLRGLSMQPAGQLVGYRP